MRLARIAGLLYLIPTFCGPFSMMYVPSVIVVPGDAGATADRLLSSETLFRLGLVSDSAIVLSELALTAALYVLLKRVSRPIALTAAFARLAMAVVQAVNLLPALAALHLLRAAPAGLEAVQVRALALSALEVKALGVHVWEVLFALHCALLGVLLYRSGTFPRALGVLMLLASAGYGLNGVGNLLLPAGAKLFAAIVAVAAIGGEVPFVLWLLFGRDGRDLVLSRGGRRLRDVRRVVTADGNHVRASGERDRREGGVVGLQHGRGGRASW
ncbi:MAG: DUF4386 domain-containing protein [Deltaproteobacteria bacterium]|nr:DUF4386 domain-containing protein [Deltaproteobacteria bacterium]